MVLISKRVLKNNIMPFLECDRYKDIAELYYRTTNHMIDIKTMIENMNKYGHVGHFMSERIIFFMLLKRSKKKIEDIKHLLEVVENG